MVLPRYAWRRLYQQRLVLLLTMAAFVWPLLCAGFVYLANHVDLLQGLEPEFREVFTLHAFERRSYKDIATALDIPQNTVGTRLLRARRKLRVLLLGGREEVGT